MSGEVYSKDIPFHFDIPYDTWLIATIWFKRESSLLCLGGDHHLRESH